MAIQGYMSVKGQKQGQFHGETTQNKRKDSIPILAIQMGLVAPRDAASGQSTGRRLYRPVVITKEWGASSPQGLIACSTNEILLEITIEFAKTNPAGELYTSQTIKLTDANIVEIQRFTRAQDGTLLLAEGRSETLELETWAFTFRKIEVDDNPTKISFVDDWSVTT
jgi:type VI secretion system secreted protein Hcp